MNKLSIVIPVWNEEKNILPLIERIDNALDEKGIKYEIIFIDDNSKDKTAEIILSLTKKYPIQYQKKVGKKGKAYSLVEGFAVDKYDKLAMIDADLQYPPEALPQMVEKIEKGADIVVARRKNNKSPKIRQLASKVYRGIFGKLLFGLSQDIQSGLKVFTKEAYTVISPKPISSWTFDLDFLNRAREAGFKIESHDIAFEKRVFGKSKISLLKTTGEIGTNALMVKAKGLKPLIIPPVPGGTMQGAGVGHKRNKYVTHTTLHYSKSALKTFVGKQIIAIACILLLTEIGFFLYPLTTLQVIVGALSTIYFIDVIFNLFLILKSLHIPQEVTFSESELDSLSSKDLPIYSILCPLYKEALLIPQFLDAISRLDYPKNKLDVILLLEEDDKQTIEIARKMDLPSFTRIVVVPHSMPKTKPKACNYGLSEAKGEYLVIFYAENIPNVLQFKKAFLAFQKLPKSVACLQAKLNYYNPHQNLLTRFFTAEYSLWFDITLTGLQSIGTSIPLGGTSNHFRTHDLIALEGWDPFNVTEDADLGIRLFRKGYKTAIIDSVTLEEANSKVGNWIRQRSRWIKGYMQTYLVHTRDLLTFTKERKLHSLIFHLVVGGKIAFILINPLLWIATIAYFTLYKFIGPQIEALYPSYIFYIAVTSLVFGNFLFLFYYMIGVAKRQEWSLIKYIFLIPFYWLLISFAGAIALYQLILKPHYWEKTVHGFHLNKNTKDLLPQVIIEVEEDFGWMPFPKKFRKRLAKNLANRKTYLSGAFLVAANMLGNILNFAFNIFLGRAQNVSDFGLLSLMSSLIYLVNIPVNALSTTTNYRSGYLDVQKGSEASHAFCKV